MIYAISGHRQLSLSDAITIRYTLDDLGPSASLIDSKLFPATFYFGGAVGTDTVALEHCGTVYPKTRRIVVVPNQLKHQPPTAVQAIEHYATDVIELNHRITRIDAYEAYRIRNRYLVEHADQLIAFCNLNRKSSGTQNAILQALFLKKPYKVVHIDG